MDLEDLKAKALNGSEKEVKDALEEAYRRGQGGLKTNKSTLVTSKLRCACMCHPCKHDPKTSG